MRTNTKYSHLGQGSLRNLQTLWQSSWGCLSLCQEQGCQQDCYLPWMLEQQLTLPYQGSACCSGQQLSAFQDQASSPVDTTHQQQHC